MKMNSTKDLIKNSGISQASLAKKLGISRQQLYSILKSNRKTKYSAQIAELLNDDSIKKENKSNFDYTSSKIDGAYIEKLPIIYQEDILRILDGLQGVNLLKKPFYHQWPFVMDGMDIKNNFCMRITDSLNLRLKKEVAFGVFRFYISLKHDEGKYFLVYTKDNKKIVMGHLEINQETKTKSIINNSGIYPISKEDIILAECIQIVLYLQ